MFKKILSNVDDSLIIEHTNKGNNMKNIYKKLVSNPTVGQGTNSEGTNVRPTQPTFKPVRNAG